MDGMNTKFGSVTDSVVRFRNSNGRIDEIIPQHISAVSIARDHHPVIGAILLGFGGLLLLGVAWVLFRHTHVKVAQLVSGLLCVAFGWWLTVGRIRVNIETAGGTVKSRALPYKDHPDAEAFVNGVRSVVFRS